MRPIHDLNNGYPFGFLGLIISMSIYLARDFAKTNEKLLARERQAQACLAFWRKKRIFKISSRRSRKPSRA